MFETSLGFLDGQNKLKLNREVWGWGAILLGLTLNFLGLFGFLWQTNFSSSSNLQSDEDLIVVASRSAEIAIDLGGAIKNPGIYRVKPNARLAQVIGLAGGFRSTVDKNYLNHQLNLSKRVTDEEKIYIPFRGEEEAVNLNANLQASALVKNKLTVKAGENGLLGLASPAQKISINQASKTDLQSLVGVGEVRAQKIIDNRPYQALSELVDKKLLPSSIYQQNLNSLVL